ncbi:MAG: site-specific integrase [Clostridiales bacterium]|nr:site-specific integrase [Clostridiales bacterium]
MKKLRIGMQEMEEFKQYMVLEEKSKATIDKYLRDIVKFLDYMKNDPLTKERIINYKELLQKDYSARSVNTILAALNSFFRWLDHPEFLVKQLKIQQQAFCMEEKELSRQEYFRLVKAARRSGNSRLETILQTICCTGIRVSELSFITVRAVRQGVAEICCKGKNRRIMIPGNLRKKLLLYIQKKEIKDGMVFITRGGNMVDRSNIWREMKSIAKEAGVLADKIFPHNLRHLFARCFYEIDKDMAKLADVLGHSNINTTRIYMISTGEEHRRQLERLRLMI